MKQLSSDELSKYFYGKLQNNKRKILLISRWHYPAANPRAFRTTELLRELALRDYDVTAILPSLSRNIPQNVDVRYINIGEDGACSISRRTVHSKRSKTALVAMARKLSLYFCGDTPKGVVYGLKLLKILPELLADNKYDAVISISYPFYCHIATALCKNKSHGEQPVFIADCGDPVYATPATCNAFYIKWLEGMVLRCFDYVAVPVEAAKAAYRGYGIDDRLVVIPQGFRLLDMDENSYKPNSVPTFCYAGVFYEKIRNPIYFLEYLCSLDRDFKFIVYLLKDEFSMQVLQKYKAILKDKLEVRAPLPREKLIHAMSYMDFVVNIDNENLSQKPSKLIDYAMSKRPIISFNRGSFAPKVFEDFMNGDYRQQEQIDISQYDIRSVADSFARLFSKENEGKE